ncbi:ribose 5-phosphate isomerase A [Sporolactobacillus shoreae]|uniref:Ribose 5-phosphate isomerase A n=1 Tax=Sporolactobacillus shoreae TaxID=1465501 RepID=A0A4Z0GNL8_9BACL|nr:ribose 5-phosphate isomerase A [Sporolactobacillus shoreae]TGA98730.1 ribose 5-phosphate isomerase A [Sporolactobacillus shoreae]
MGTGNIKQDCAREALKIIPQHSIVGLGGGSTISYLIDFIKENKSLDLKIVTPSKKTKLLCLAGGLNVLYTETVDHVDLAFDGCDQVDEQLHALKSGGGIHTKEKLIASMADDYILLVDESKFVKKLTFELPVVLEVLGDAVSYVKRKAENLGGKPVMRQSAAKDGFTVSDNGHPLMDVFFTDVTDIDGLDRDLRSISGVIDTSLFSGVVTRALVAGNGGMRWVSKNESGR